MITSAWDRLQDAVQRTRMLTRGRTPTGRTHDDADDDVGTVATDGALDFDPFPLLAALHREGARCVVIGQIAGILHGSTELTGDLDLLWDGNPAQIPALVAAFASVGARLHDDDRRALALEPAAFRLPKVQFDSAQAGGDCCTPALPWQAPVAPFLDRALLAVGPAGVALHYLRRDDLITMRRASGRPKDLRRADELARLPTP